MCSPFAVADYAPNNYNKNKKTISIVYRLTVLETRKGGDSGV
jgi:hypothetical protein